jgi:preprotein translocase subunit YajC|tara:strand:+ start:70 stop:324 length:255 start_codon:yes stop_codon:yes gene_type:complete
MYTQSLNSGGGADQRLNQHFNCGESNMNKLVQGTSVLYTLTGLNGTVKKIMNDGITIENEKGETLNPSLKEVETMLSSGALKVL